MNKIDRLWGVQDVADFLGVPVALISIGPGRDQVAFTDVGRASALFERGAPVG